MEVAERDGKRAGKPVMVLNAHLVEPLWHPPECPGLSGLYALINGIRLALAGRHHLTSSEVHELINTALKYFSGRRTIQQTLLHGVRMGHWRTLGDIFCDQVRRHHGLVALDRMPFQRQSGFQDVIAGIQTEIDRGRPVVMLLRGGHYTVVRGYTDSSLLLFDSCGAWWIAKKATAVTLDGVMGRHSIHPPSLHCFRA